MGCDIHFHVEKLEEGKWVSADTWYTDSDESDPEYRSLYKWGPGLERLGGPMYSSRNYGLFAMLADVRNGYGFAGVDTGDAVVPISEPRGMPENVSPEVRASCDRWDCDGHSHTHMTVQELMEYDWTRTMTKRGFVSKKEFARFKLSGRPESWCGGTSADKISNDEMMELILRDCDGDKLTWRDFHKMEGGMFTSPNTQITWYVPYYEQASEFLSETMPKLWRLGKPDEVRIVIWFDN